MGIKEWTCHDEHWVLYGIVETLYCTHWTDIILSVNYNGILKNKIYAVFLVLCLSWVPKTTKQNKNGYKKAKYSEVRSDHNVVSW